jgi:hypothetical protein
MEPTRVMIDLHLPEAAGWRGLLTQAQQETGRLLPEPVEEYVVCMLYRTLGNARARQSLRSPDFARELLANGVANARSLAAVGDQSLLFAGLFPDHAIRQRIPLSYFVQIGQHAYREHASGVATEERPLFRALGERFVPVLDVLLSIRERQDGGPCLDGLNAFQLWSEAGSSHGWQTLRQMTSALPASVTSVRH